MLSKIINTYKVSYAGLSKESWLLSGVILLNRCGYMAVPFMGLYITQALHRPESDAGLIISLFGVGAILGSLAGGKLTDTFGFRPVQIFSSIIGGILFLVFSQVDSFAVLCILSVLISFFYDAFRPANFAAIAAYAKSGNETRSYSLNRLATNIGFSFGIAMGGFIAAYNYKLLFMINGLVSVLVGLAIFAILPTIKGYRKAIIASTKDIFVRKPWQDKMFVNFIILTTVFATCFFLMFRVVPIFFKQEWHINEAIIGLILGVNGAIIALFEMVLISKLEQKRTAKFYIIVGVIITSISFAFLMIPTAIPIVLGVLCVVCFTFGEMLSMPFINTVVIMRSNKFNRGQYAAGFSIAWSIAQITPIVGFYMAEKIGYNFLWVSIFFLLLLCAYGYSLLNLEDEPTTIKAERNNF